MTGLLPLDLTEVIYEELLAGRRENDGLLHPSGHLRGSLRHTQLDVAGAPKLPQALIREVPMWTGTMWHEYIQGRLKRLGVPCMQEVNLTPWLPPGWGGTADLFIWNPSLRAFVLVDLKTTKGDSLKWIRKDGAKLEHVWQVSSYWHAAKKAGWPLAKEALLYYLPMSDTRDQYESAEPLEIEVSPIPLSELRPHMKTRQEAVQAYLDSLPFGHEVGVPLPLDDYLTDELAPVQEREQKLWFERRTGQWKLKLSPNWSTRFCAFPLEVCDCSTQRETIVGAWAPDGDYIPRDGFEDIVPELAPTFD